MADEPQDAGYPQQGGVGKLQTEGDLSRWMEDALTQGSLAGILAKFTGPPVGTMAEWPVAAAPSNTDWLLVIPGEAFDGEAYPDLATLLGGAMFPAEWEGKFLPMAGGLTGYTHAEEGGDDTLVLAEANLPPHTHSYTDDTRTLQTDIREGIVADGGTLWTDVMRIVTAAARTTGPGSGSTDPMDNRPFFYAMNRIIKGR